MVRLDALSNEALGILTRLLADEPVTNWILQNLVSEREARAAGGHGFPLTVPALALEDARILNRYLIESARILEDLVYGPHGDNGPDAPFLEGARLLAEISEELGRQSVAGAGRLVQ